MIWIFERLTEQEKKNLESLNPLMDFEYSGNQDMYSWQTYHCIPPDRRFIRFFTVSAVKQGFICDDLFEARTLSTFIAREISIDDFKHLVPQYRMVARHLELANPISVRLIAVPVRVVYAYFVKYYSHGQNESFFNPADLAKWNIHREDFHDYDPFCTDYSPTAAQDCYDALTPDGVRATITILKELYKDHNLKPEQKYMINGAIEAFAFFPDRWPETGFLTLTSVCGLDGFLEIGLSGTRVYIDVRNPGHHPPLFEFHFNRRGTFAVTKESLSDYIEFAKRFNYGICDELKLNP